MESEFTTFAGAFSPVVRDLAISAAAISGGTWAVFRFLAERSAQRASAELDRLKADTDRLRLQAKSAPSIKLSLDLDPPMPEQDGSYYVSGSVIIENVGNGATSLGFGTHPISIASLSLDLSGDQTSTIVARIPLRTPHAHFHEWVVDPGTSRSLPFIGRVESPGLYVTSFRAELTTSDRVAADTVSEKTDLPIHWTIWKYTVIGQSSSTPPAGR